MSKQEMHQALEDVADVLGVAMDRLADLAEQIDSGSEGTEEAMETMDQARWMRGARRELSELIRDVKGRNHHRLQGVLPKVSH
ncbi:MAG TPA: hypothetical protein VFN72_00050 [Solirubrobacterales bacterium]|nr:hypothetical protein [Solirubrobacterales bacterium]